MEIHWGNTHYACLLSIATHWPIHENEADSMGVNYYTTRYCPKCHLLVFPSLLQKPRKIVEWIARQIVKRYSNRGCPWIYPLDVNHDRIIAHERERR